MLNFLSTSANWLLDGTFKTVPNLTYQLLVVHGQWRDTHTTIPCAYFLLNNKDQDIYEEALAVLRRLVNNAVPDNVMMDFELAPPALTPSEARKTRRAAAKSWSRRRSNISPIAENRRMTMKLKVYDLKVNVSKNKCQKFAYSFQKSPTP